MSGSTAYIGWLDPDQLSATVLTTSQRSVSVIPHLERAVELDLDYGQAWATLASVYWITYRKNYAWALIVNPDKSNAVSWKETRIKAGQ